MPETRLSIPSGTIALEAVLHRPAGAGAVPAVVVCHPHPQYGGDMHNGVVMVVVRGLLGRGIAALRFNFRGTGRSGGAYDGGTGEQDDVRAALACTAALDGLDPGRIGLAGYSFGAWMAAGVAGADVPALALIALPLSAGPERHPALAAYPNPLLLVAGDHDHVCPADALRGLAGALAEARAGGTGAEPAPVETHIVAGTDHFWAGDEDTLEQIVGGFFTRHLGPA